MRRRAAGQRQHGAAILTAMLTVVLVATLTATALWQQWRGVEIEAAQRTRLQSAWVLNGALDWARLILREDGRKGGADHLAEPWAVPLEQARLSTFLAADRSDTLAAEAAQSAFLSGRITDLQSRLNVSNLVPMPVVLAKRTSIAVSFVKQRIGPTTKKSAMDICERWEKPILLKRRNFRFNRDGCKYFVMPRLLQPS
jgi:hypothetical protein